MLIEFSVGNYRSFKEKATFSMVATHVTAKDKQVDVNNTFDAGNNLRLLKTAAMYGANASGKSNFAKALSFMREFTLNSSRDSQAADAISVEPFQLSVGTKEQPSFFEIVFLLQGKRFRYGFEATEQLVITEWLYRASTSREAKLFDRQLDEIGIGSSFREGRGIQQRTRSNALFLSVVAQFNGEIARQIMEWFHTLNVQLGSEDTVDYTDTLYLLGEEDYKNEIIQLIKQLDLGIYDILVERSNPNSTITAALSHMVHNRATEPDDPLNESRKQLLRYMERPEAQTLHRVFDERGQLVDTYTFDFDQHESEGTKKLFGLAGSLVPALERGLVVVVDELDARLHPLITRAIIALFNNPDTNPHNAQLIFTTHDTNLLQNTMFRRDQVWFVEKDRFGASHLYSLVEFKVRNDASFEKDYIQGRYGAIPFIGDLGQVLGSSDG